MALFTHPLFGKIDLAKPDCWFATLTIGGKQVHGELDINDVLAADVIMALPHTVQELERLDQIAREAILEDAESGDDDSAAALYVEHHHEELEPTEFKRVFGVESPDGDNMKTALARLSLVRVGLYPEDEDRKVLFDYSIDRDVTQYVLCVSLDASGNVASVDVES